MHDTAEETFSRDFPWQWCTYFESRFLFDGGIGFQLCEDYRLQPQDKGTMIEHHRTPFRLNRARNIAAKIPISTLQCCFSDLRDWLTRTSSHVLPGQVSNEINHGHVGTSISVVHAKKFGHVGSTDRYAQDIAYSFTLKEWKHVYIIRRSYKYECLLIICNSFLYCSSRFPLSFFVTEL